MRTLSEIEAIEDELEQLANDVSEERSTYGTWAKGAGCIIGAFMGSGGGPAGMVSGCNVGSQVVGLAVDYAYDGELIQTSLEDELIAKREELEEYEIELDALSTRFPQYQAVEWVEDREEKLGESIEAYDDWADAFYGKEGIDYAMDAINIGINYAASKVGESVLNNLWDSTFDTNFSGTNPPDVVVDVTPTSQYDFSLPDYSNPYEYSNLWQEYLEENYTMQVGAGY